MRRRGVSLIEVMFAIGVIAIGLLGVLAVVPFGLYQVGRGNVADRSSRAALNAVEEFEIQGMRRPDNWIYADGTPVQSATQFPVAPHVPAGYSFCIDARFVASPENQTGAAKLPIALGSPSYFDARFFPYYTNDTSSPLPATSSGYLFNDVYNLSGTARVIPFTQNPAQPRMLRITLKQSAGVPLNIGPPSLGGTPVDTSARMTLSQANRIFMADDDLVFEIPEQKSLHPIQDTAGGIRRQFDGSISWMATLVPRADAGGFAAGEYTLSLVIFHKRTRPYMFDDANGNGSYDSGEETDSERIVTVASFEGAGFAGGDVTLAGTTARQLDLKEGEWLMLAGSAGVSGIEAPDFRWYRIVHTEKDPEYDTASGTYQRVATLQGADWQRTEWHLPSTNAAFRPTQATLMKGVVAVYEKAIQLETTVAYPQ